MEKNFFINSIKKDYELNGSNIYNLNSKFISKCINENDNVEKISIKDISKGYFYFMFYDLSGKSSKMEKINPLLIIDTFDTAGTRLIYGVSLNFIPITIRVLFFNNLFNYNLSVLKDNLNLNTMKQDPLSGVNFTNIYKLLYSIGFEWCIRKFDIKLINKIYKINTNILKEFITMSTSKFTGVNDNKLLEIWKKKINEQETRQKKLIQEMIKDFNSIENELNKNQLSLTEKNEYLEKSLSLINKI